VARLVRRFFEVAEGAWPTYDPELAGLLELIESYVRWRYAGARLDRSQRRVELFVLSCLRVFTVTQGLRRRAYRTGIRPLDNSPRIARIVGSRP
jgi:hypothetical protein